MKTPLLNSIIISTLALFGLSNIVSAQVCFNPKTDYLCGNQPHAVISADFNNDGKLDLAVANRGNSSNVSIFLGNGTGGFGGATNFALGPGADAASLISGDFNNDGNPDLAVAELSASKIGILLGNGAGSFSAPVNFTVSYPTSVITADFNKDGNPDLAVTNFITKGVSILIGDGSGSFVNSATFTVGTYPTAVISADFNADNNADLAVANGSSDNVSILLGTGTGSFAPADSFLVGDGPRGIITGDFNVDGKADLATSNGGGGVSILLGNGAGSFATATLFPAGTTPQSLYSADFDGDGNVDIVTANSNGNDISILTGNGTGSFGAPTNFAVDLNPEFVISADFNGDGNPDLAVANKDSDSTSVLLNCSITTSTKQLAMNAEEVNIFPNPSTGIFNFSSATLFSNLTIYNLLGEVVYSKLFNTSKAEVNLVDRPKGVYFYQIVDEKNKMKTGKIIIE